VVSPAQVVLSPFFFVTDMTKQKELIREYLAKDKQKSRPAPSKKPKQREI